MVKLFVRIADHMQEDKEFPVVELDVEGGTITEQRELYIPLYSKYKFPSFVGKDLDWFRKWLKTGRLRVNALGWEGRLHEVCFKGKMRHGLRGKVFVPSDLWYSDPEGIVDQIKRRDTELYALTKGQ